MRNDKLTKLIANELASMRTKKGLTQQEVSERLKVSRTTIANYEQGRRDIPADIFIEFCEVCSVDPFILLDKLCKKARQK